MRISYEEVYETLYTILIKKEIAEDKAKILAETITNSTLDGVVSHGINRFTSVLNLLDEGLIDKDVEPSCQASFGAIERWDGHQGFGITNAKLCMNRAIELAQEFGIGIVALRNTNHWLRGGTYGWQAADAGCIGLCWTNTMPNMPAWGATDCRLGNNPMVIAMPRANQEHVVLDMAMAQFSYGNLTTASLENRQLSIDGGFNRDGQLTKDPDEILETSRVLQMGFWKGSGLSLVLDLMASALSGGNSVENIGKLPKETSISQVFIAIDPRKVNNSEDIEATVNQTLDYIKASELDRTDRPVRYPGERAYATRIEQRESGIEIHEDIWNEIMLKTY
jgi:3-dehydro-L-gulonate 2-dehydrogenase